MAPQDTSASQDASAAQETSAPALGQSELIVILKDQTQAAGAPQGITSSSADSSSVQDILDRHGASMNLLFGPSVERVRNDQADLSVASLIQPDAQETLNAPTADASTVADVPDLASFHRVEAAPEKLEKLAKELLEHDSVDAAYIKPAGAPPIVHIPAPLGEAAPPVTPNFIANQIYLNAAPAGIDANYAQTVPGGRGDGVRVIDCEWGWQFTHEDLRVNTGGVIAGTNDLTTAGFVNHGTAVAGIVSGDLNNYGVTGIVPNAIFSASSFVGQTQSQCVLEAAKRLNAGDILLLEIHIRGPAPANGNTNPQFGYIPFEWWPDNLAAVRFAVAKGIIVVEAGGNGFQNLDDPIYNTGTNFGSAWRNPFNPNNPSSGAVLVGAGCPPSGTHGRDYGPDRSRCSFSNYGSRIDCQGWGYEVTSTGYGDLQNGARDVQYTNQFSGTSSASPIIVGTLGAVQGVLKRANRRLLTPARARQLLRASGSPQQASSIAPLSQRIGNRPNLRQLIPLALQG